MRVITNEQRLKRSRQLAQVLFLVSLAILFGGLFLNTVTSQSSLFILVPCLVLPLGLVATISSVRLTNLYVRLPHPEDAIREGLKGINRRSILFNYLTPANHILVSPQGVYTLIPRFQLTRFTVNGDKWTDRRKRGPLGPAFLFLKQEDIGQPFKDAARSAEALQALLDQKVPALEIKVQPVVVLINPKAELVVENPTYPVVFADSKKRPSLKSLIREDKRKDAPMVSEEDIEAIYEALIESLPESRRTAQLVENEA